MASRHFFFFYLNQSHHIRRIIIGVFPHSPVGHCAKQTKQEKVSGNFDFIHS